jgi:outer membrane protein OmpA-like peptidoglycan-associated protein
MPSFLNSARSALVICALAVLAMSGCEREGTPKNTAPVIEVTSRAPFDAHLTLANNSGRIDYGGTVDTSASRVAVETALQAVYAGDRATGAIDVDDAANPPMWASNLEPLLRVFEPVQGAALRFEGDRIILSGQIDDATLARLRDAARQSFPNAKLEGLLADVSETPGSAELAALAAAPNPDAVKLTLALNQLSVRFDEGQGNVSDSSLATVAQAAKAIAAAPAGTRLLIVGPVTASQDAENDIFLSKQRAEAMKVQLILSGVKPGVIETRGWGQHPDGKPIEGAKLPPEGAGMRFELL